MLTSSMLTSAPRKKISFKSRILKRRHTETEFPAKKLLFEKNSIEFLNTHNLEESLKKRHERT